LDEFSKALASEVRMLLGEVGKLREEKRALQQLVKLITRLRLSCPDELCSEIGTLLTLKSKYGPGGEFDPDWFVLNHLSSRCVVNLLLPRRPDGGPFPVPPAGPEMPVPEPAVPEEPIPARPGWRTVTQRTSRKSRRRETATAPAMPAAPAQAETRPPVSSWATWQRK
jgi:hypothetical protein